MKELHSKATGAILVLAFLLQGPVCWASLENEMQGLFDTMTNITDGGYHKGIVIRARPKTPRKRETIGSACPWFSYLST